MNLIGLPFLVVTLATVVLMRARMLRRWRVETLAIASLAFVGSVVGSIGDAVCLLVMAAIGWAGVNAVTRDHRPRVASVAIAGVLAAFFLARQILPAAQAPHWLMVGRSIGLSYVMFRVIHLIVDAQGDELPTRLRLRDYVCYLFCYLTFLAGPIQRIQDFLPQVARPPRNDLPEAAFRWVPLIISGALKFTLIAAVFFSGFTWSQTGDPTVLTLAIGWLSFAAYLYVSFAGYTDIVRGIGGLIDLDLPRNFERPFAAANFLDIWSRWHISLSDWFKLYVFNPSVKAMIARVDRPVLTPYLGAAGYFLTFFLMGLWHGVSLRFVLYGLCLGAAASANKLYQTFMLRRLGRARWNELTRRPLYAASAQGLAVSAFILALGFLWIRHGQGSPLAWTVSAGIVVALVALLVFAAALAAPLVAMKDRFAARRPLLLAFLQAACVLTFLAFSHARVAPLLYENF